MFTSPMQRACSTTKPVCDALQAPGVVMPDLVEVGGLYHAYQDPNGYWQKGVSSTAGSAQDLWNRFQFDVSQLPQEGPWDGGRGNESTELALRRAQRVADWLMKLAVIKSASLDSNQVPDCVVLVSHADFLALLLAALNKIDAGKHKQQHETGEHHSMPGDAPHYEEQKDPLAELPGKPSVPKNEGLKPKTLLESDEVADPGHDGQQHEHTTPHQEEPEELARSDVESVDDGQVRAEVNQVLESG